MPVIIKFAVSLFLVASLSACDVNFPSRNKLEQIKHSGVLKVLTRIDPTTYYEGPEGFAGLEYDLVMLFAEHLGVKVRFETPGSFDEILRKIAKGKADIAAAGLTITDTFLPPEQAL